MYRCLGARAGVTLSLAGDELRSAAAALGCGLPAWAQQSCSLTSPNDEGESRAALGPELKPGVGAAAAPGLVQSHLLPPPPPDTASGPAGAARAGPACESLSQHGPGGEEAKGAFPEASLGEDGEPASFIPPTKHFCFEG